MAPVRRAPPQRIRKAAASQREHSEITPAVAAIVDRGVSWIQKRSLVVFLLLVLVGTLRIVSTYSVLSHTSDEPAHIAAGLQWLSEGKYEYEAQHPPLARVAAALGLYFAGFRSSNEKNMWDEGLSILYRDGRYDRTLTIARLGILPFFWVACVVVYIWGKRYLGEPGAFFAVFAFSFLPPVLAHAGLATTDMALTAMVSASFLATMVWLDTPGPAQTLLFGGTTALAVLSKFSALPFLPCALSAALVWYLITERPRISQVLRESTRYFLPLCGAALLMIGIIWGGYRFSFGRIPPLPMRLQPPEVAQGIEPIPGPSSFRVPAPELFEGIQEVSNHNDKGHEGYLLGHRRESGWWYYYFIALAVKTPLPFFALVLCGLFCLDRGKGWGVGLALAFSVGILLFASLFSRINIGVRHILPVYLGFAVIAGAGAAQLLQSARTSRAGRWISGVLVVWLAASSLRSHPDYLAYFNELPGDQPEQFLADSDLDWGQEMKRLTVRLRELGVHEFAFTPYFPDLPARPGLPPHHPVDPINPSPGWNALNVTAVKAWRLGMDDTRPIWPERIKPTEKVGEGIWLWYFPPGEVPRSSAVR